MTYTIPESKRDDIRKAVARMEKKAQRYGTDLTVMMGDPYAKKIPVYEVGYDFANHEYYKDLIRTSLVEVFDVDITGDMVRRDGYSILASVEHLDGGNIVNAFGGNDVKMEWINSDCRCEHCKTDRVRRWTYIVREDATGSEMQVGKSCLKDYCGIDPQGIGLRNDLEEIILDYDIDRHDYSVGSFTPVYDTVETLALAIRIYKQYGYVKSDRPNSNKDRLYNLACNEKADPTADEMSAAQQMAAVISNMEDRDAVAYLLSDTRTLVRSEYCKSSHFGYLAYAPVAYEKYQEARRREAEREAEREAQMGSQYVGTVGKRQEFEIAECSLVTSWETQFGMTYLYKFVDTDGNVLVWFASGAFGHWTDDGVGSVCRFVEETDVRRIKATVKAHNERDGIRQTVINRVKAVG